MLGGDSAGGGLALALMLKLRDRGLPLPAAATLFSPWTDLACTGRSLDANARSCAMLKRDGVEKGAAFYLGGTDPTTPLASPLYGNFHGLPSLLIHVGRDECLLDDSVRVADRVRQAGIACTIRTWPVVPHAWQILSFLPEAGVSLGEAAAFLREALERPRQDGQVKVSLHQNGL